MKKQKITLKAVANYFKTKTGQSFYKRLSKKYNNLNKKEKIRLVRNRIKAGNISTVSKALRNTNFVTRNIFNDSFSKNLIDILSMYFPSERKLLENISLLNDKTLYSIYKNLGYSSLYDIYFISSDEKKELMNNFLSYFKN